MSCGVLEIIFDWITKRNGAESAAAAAEDFLQLQPPYLFADK